MIPIKQKKSKLQMLESQINLYAEDSDAEDSEIKEGSNRLFEDNDPVPIPTSYFGGDEIGDERELHVSRSRSQHHHVEDD